MIIYRITEFTGSSHGSGGMAGVPGQDTLPPPWYT